MNVKTKMREASVHLDRAYDCYKELRDHCGNSGAKAGYRELSDAMDLLNLSERMAERGSRDMRIREERHARVEA